MDTHKEQKALLRRHRDTLYIAGTGTMVLGLWSMAEGGLSMLATSSLQEGMLTGWQKGMSTGWEQTISSTWSIVATLVILIVLMLIQIYVGMCARRESRGERRGSFYLVLAGVFVVLDVILVGAIIVLAAQSQLPVDETVVYLIVSFLSAFSDLQLIVSCLRARHLSAALED